MAKYKGYKEYFAIISQTGTNAPTATVVYSSLPGTLAYSYVSTGLYELTLTGAFLSGTTQSFCNFSVGNTANPSQYMTIYRYSNDALRIKTFDTGTATNGLLNLAYIYIRVYDVSNKIYTKFDGRKMYSAIVTQTSTNAPTITKLSNYFNFTPSFAYNAVGDYRDISFGESVANDVAILRFRNIPHATDTGFYYFLYDAGGGTNIYLESGASGVKANDKLSASPIQIEKFSSVKYSRKYNARRRLVLWLEGVNGANPTVNILLNELKETPTITRSAEGVADISTVSNIFTANKTMIFAHQGDRRGTPMVVIPVITSATKAQIYAYNSGVADDVAMQNTFLEIVIFD